MSGNDDDAPKRPRDWTAPSIAIFALVGGYAIGKVTGDWIVAGLVMISGLTAASGYRLGAIAVGSLIGGCAAAYSLAPKFAYVAEPFLQSKLGLTGLVNRGAALATVAIAIALLALAIGCLLRGMLLSPTGKANRADRLLGAVFGACEGVAIASILLCGALFLAPFARQQLAANSAAVITTPVSHADPNSAPPNSFDEATAEKDGFATWVSQAVVQVAEQAEQSRVAPLAEKYDPIQKSPWGRTMKDVVTVMGDPDAMQQFFDHPTFGQLKENPGFQAAADQIANDPEVMEILDEHGGVNGESLAKLLASPRFMELIDQTGVAREMSGIAKHLRPALHDVAQQAATK